MRPLQIMTASLLLLMHLSPASGKLADFVDVGQITPLNLGTWAIGDGDQTMVEVICTGSANYDDVNPRPNLNPPATTMPYQFKVTDLSTPAGYYLYLNADDTNTGNARVQVQFEHRDTIAGTAYETLIDDVYDTHAHDGQFRNCRNGDNGELRISITATQLEQARAGYYEGNFRAAAQGGSSGTAVSSVDFRITLTVAPAVQITALQNVNLGVWAAGFGDLAADETFCVYSNNATASYNLTITSPNQDAAFNFYVVNPAMTVQVPYTLGFKDNVTPGPGTTVAGTPISGTGNNTTPGCGGIDNAKIDVTILAADLGGAPVDTYSDTITLLVEPI